MSVSPAGVRPETTVLAAPPQGRMAVAAAACLAAAVPLSALAGAALWWRRRRARPQACAFRPLPAAEEADAGGAEGARGQLRCAAGAAAARRRRLQERLGSRLRSEGRRLEVVPPGALPAVLAHNLSRGSLQRGQAGHGAQPEQRERSGMPPLSERAAACGVWAEEASGHAAAATPRQWGLPTESLRLKSGCLEVRGLRGGPEE